MVHTHGVGGPSPSIVLCAVFFLSGASALIFEVVWFRQAGLVFGNSVWASTLVLSSFMGGLALGNAGVARHGDRLRRPVRAYATLEVAIAVTAVGVVVALPALPSLLAPVFRPFLDNPWVLNPLRLLLSFALLMIPSTAMGATLPVVVKALSQRDPNFGNVLGRLYGWNTLGAVTGALAAELVLIGPFGLRGTGLAAGALNVLGALVALATVGGITTLGAEPAGSAPDARTGRRFLAAAFLSGAILLALEVVWFRFLVLFVSGTSLTFAVLLAVVLAGIGAGGLLGARWLRLREGAEEWIPQLALASAVLTLGLYAGFDSLVRNAVALVVDVNRHYFTDPLSIAALAAALMLPTSVLSGVLFTWIGHAARRELGTDARAAGLVTLSNTVGGMLGAALAGFALLPALGVEGSLVLLSLTYVGVAACGSLPGSLRPVGRGLRALGGPGAALLLLLVFFPYGKMQGVYARIPALPFLKDGMKVVALREGPTETAMYLRKDLWGVPRSHRLLTNGYSMASNRWPTRRYMKLYTYWAAALHPELRDALLISYGAGSTARALLDTPGIEHVDVVDISRGIIELSDVVFEAERNPVRDPRVDVHIEDGRFFLLTSDRRYDLITGEPPPPSEAGIVNLYTREYFQLAHDRLEEHGIITYWLPLHSTTDADARAITRAFCDVFADCSLWNAMGLDWILAGSRGGLLPASESDLVRQWKDPTVGPELRLLGFEVPEQLGALFLADAEILKRVVAGTPPLVDDYPHRLSSDYEAIAAPDRPWEFKDAFEDPALARERFAASAMVRRVWPPGLRERSLAYFEYQDIINAALATPGNPQREVDEFDVHRVLTGSDLHTLAFWVFGSDPITARIAASNPPEAEQNRASIELHRGIAALADRDYAAAERRFARAVSAAPNRPTLLRYQVLALCLDGRIGRAAEVARKAVGDEPTPEERAYWERMEQIYALPSPLSPGAPDAGPAPPAH